MNRPTSTQTIHQSSLPATAIGVGLGVGLGVPFGIVAIGFLIFLFWRDVRSKDPRGPKQDALKDKRTRGNNTLIGGEMDGNGLQLELQGSTITAELHENRLVQ